MNLPGLDVESRPRPAVPSLYIQTGLLFLIGAAAVIALHPGALMASPRHNPVTLVVTHMLVLGFGTLITFGALEQMVPVITGRKVTSERYSRTAYALFVPGLLLQLAGFAAWQPYLIAAGGTLITLGTALFTLPYVPTLWERLRSDLTAPFIFSSLIYVNLTVFLGVASAVQLKTLWWPWLFWHGLPFHLILGGLGWFTQIIIGVSYKLIPMFITTTGAGDLHVRRVCASFNIGLLLALLSAAASWTAGAAAGLTVVGVTCAVYAWDVRGMVKRRIRRRIGAGMKQSLVAVLYLILAAALSALLLARALPIDGLSADRWVVVAGLLFACGWVGSVILGMLSKIVPMLVWLDLFAGRVGERDTPTIAQLIDERAVGLGGIGYHAGLLTLAVAFAAGHPVAATWAAALFLLGVVVLAGTLIGVWSAR